METSKGEKRQSAFALLRALKRRKFYLLVPMVLITGSVALYTRNLPVRYRAQALVAAVSGVPEPNAGRVDPSTTVNVQEHLRAIRETLVSPAVIETVIREFRMYDVASGRDLERATEQIKPRIKINVDSPDAFYVGFEGERPLQVMQVANRLAALFVERTSVLHGQREARVDGLLDAEVDRLRSQLREQEEGLKAYRQSAAQGLPDRLAANFKLLENLQQQTQTKSDQIAEAQARRQAVVNELLALENQGALESAPREKTANETTLDELRLKLRQLKARYTAESPEIQRTEKEIRDLEALGTPLGPRRQPSPLHMRYVALQAELTSIDQRVKSYQQERTELTSQMSVYEKRINASPGLETTLTQRMRDAALTRAQYENMLAKQQTAKLNQKVEDSKQAAFKVADAAQVPTAPYGPQRRQIMLLALLASMGIGLAAVLIAEHMDSSFQTIEEVQGFINLPVLSSVPNIGNRLTKSRPVKQLSADPLWLEPSRVKREGFAPEQRRVFQQHRLTVLSDPQSIASQQYGILTLKVQRWKEQTEGQVLVVTSAAGGEGKSLTALNLSMSLAGATDGRVLLVDCDLRRPQVHERLGLGGSQGLSDLLIQPDQDLEPFISRVGNLYVMTGGTRVSDIVGCLTSRRTEELFSRLREEYALIVLDSPPIVPIADSHFLAGLGDGVILVIRSRQTRRELLRRAVESLDATNILGVVLNDVEYGDTRYAYAYRYYNQHYTSRR